MTHPLSERLGRPDPLSGDRIRKGMKTRWLGKRLVVFDSVGSTNDVAHRLAREGAPEGTVVIANRQTRGRGRRGRRWLSPPDANLYLSLILRPAGDPNRIGLFTLASAIAVARSIEESTGLPARLKWPNDIWVNRKKVSGLLLEGTVKGNRFGHLIVGIGINVNLRRETLPKRLQAKATSLYEELDRETDRIGLTRRLLENLERQYRIFRNGQIRRILDDYRDRSITLGEAVRVQDGPHSVFRGRAVGMTPEGHLVVRAPRGSERVVRTQDVIHLGGDHASGD